MLCHNFSPITVMCVALESILFILIGLYRFCREEFEQRQDKEVLL